MVKNGSNEYGLRMALVIVLLFALGMALLLIGGCTLNMVDVSLTNNAEDGSTANWSAAGATWNSEKTQSATGTVPAEAVSNLLKAVVPELPDSDVIKTLKDKINPTASGQTGAVVTPATPAETVTPEPEI